MSYPVPVTGLAYMPVMRLVILCHGVVCDFLFTSLDYKALRKWSYFLRKEFALHWSIFFPLREATNELSQFLKIKLCPFEGCQFTLKIIYCICLVYALIKLLGHA